MLADLNYILPLRESEPSPAVQRRREDRRQAQKVLPRRSTSRPLDHDKEAKEQTGALSRYA